MGEGMAARVRKPKWKPLLAKGFHFGASFSEASVFRNRAGMPELLGFK
jgi:hypothetical protein